MRRDYFSIRDEPALHPECCREKDAAEAPYGAEQVASAAERVRNSIHSEPDQPDAMAGYRDWLVREEQQLNSGKVWAATLMAGVVGGILAIPGVFLASGQGVTFHLIYLIVFGPVIEEFMKQSGMIYLLEKRPAMVRYSWQFPVAAILAAGIFAVGENLLYQYFYLSALREEELVGTMRFRWRICTALHVSCALVAAMGLRRSWRLHRQEGRPWTMSDAYGLFTVAIIIHGGYNLLAATGIIAP
ncbi:MAG: PrsW family glutamic-type intramembrane protease [Victivallales bacterium]|nr:PrsW family glutamic-type intramembrane protease [Victivallales bacterium]